MSAKISKTNINVVDFIRSIYKTDKFIPLHEPRFHGNEKKYLNECIDSTFVSSVGKFVDRFEIEIANYTGAKFAVATTNGTSALYVSLLISGVKSGHEVITQPLTFVASCNAISYCNAKPVFVDVLDDQSIDPDAIVAAITPRTKAIMPVHLTGRMANMEVIMKIADESSG